VAWDYPQNLEHWHLPKKRKTAKNPRRRDSLEETKKTLPIQKQSSRTPRKKAPSASNGELTQEGPAKDPSPATTRGGRLSRSQHSPKSDSRRGKLVKPLFRKKRREDTLKLHHQPDCATPKNGPTVQKTFPTELLTAEGGSAGGRVWNMVFGTT